MIENLIQNVCQVMIDSLDSEQLNQLKNVLYIEFKDVEVTKECRELMPLNEDSDERKIQMFKLSKKIANRQNDTLAQYEREIRNLRNAIQKEYIDITPMDLRWYFALLQTQRNNSSVTLQNRMRYIKIFYDFLVKENYLPSNPMNKLDTIKVEKIIKHDFSIPEIEDLRKVCETTRDRAMLEFLLSTGVRVSELCSLNVSDINLYNQEFKVMGKGRKERVIYVSEYCAYYLMKYFDDRE